MAGVHQHQAVEPIGDAHGDHLRDHAAHRVAEQHEVRPRPPAVIGEREGIGRQQIERVLGLVGRLLGRTVPAVVERDRVPAELGQGIEPVGEILLRTGEAVHQEQRPPAAFRTRPPACAGLY